MARRKLAMKTIRAISDEEISIASGIPLARVQAIYHLRSWDGVPMGELREFCKTQLAAYKAPRYIWILDEPLPRNASGKFVKRALQDSLDIAAAG